MQMWWFGTVSSLQKFAEVWPVWDNSDRGTTSDTGRNHMAPWHTLDLANNWHWHPGTGAVSTK